MNEKGDDYKVLKKEIENAAIKFIGHLEEPIRIISYLNTDGLAAMSILTSTFKQANLRFSLSGVKHLNQKIFDSLIKEQYKIFVFINPDIDFLEGISEFSTKAKQVFIFDCKKVNSSIKKDNITIINPTIFGFDKTITSCAGLVYLFVKIFDQENKLAHIALIGASESPHNWFFGLNKEILDEAVELKKIRLQEGPRIFGVQKEPLYKLLAYSLNNYIPGISGDEQLALKFLEGISIDGKKYVAELNERELKGVVTATALKGFGFDDEEAVNICLDGPVKDFWESFFLLDSCCKFGLQSCGIGICLKDNESKKESFDSFLIYKKELFNSLEWFFKNRDNRDKIIEGETCAIINLGDDAKIELLEPVISWLASCLYQNKVIIGIAYTLGEHVFVCIKCQDMHLNKLQAVVKKVNGCITSLNEVIWAWIPKEYEAAFVGLAMDTFKNIPVKEIV